jgi:hypothetical protein
MTKLDSEESTLRGINWRKNFISETSRSRKKYENHDLRASQENQGAEVFSCVHITVASVQLVYRPRDASMPCQSYALVPNR